MSTKNIFYSNESFEFSNSKNLSLFIEVGFHHFIASILNETSEKVYYSEYFKFSNLSDIEKQSKVLKHTFQKVYVSEINEDFTIIPEAIFEASKLDEYTSFTFGLKEHVSSKIVKQPELKTAIIYYSNNNVCDFFTKWFNNAIYSHAANTYLKLVNSIKRMSEKDLYINLYNENLLVCYFKDNQLNLINSYAYKNQDDLLYMILFLCKELDINQSDANLILSGFVSKNLISSFDEYFQKTNYISASIIDASEINTEEIYKFINTNYLYKCV